MRAFAFVRSSLIVSSSPLYVEPIRFGESPQGFYIYLLDLLGHGAVCDTAQALEPSYSLFLFQAVGLVDCIPQ